MRSMIYFPTCLFLYLASPFSLKDPLNSTEKLHNLLYKFVPTSIYHLHGSVEQVI
jgi:hypothetical protein